jgi:hypothetical protein
MSFYYLIPIEEATQIRVLQIMLSENMIWFSEEFNVPSKMKIKKSKYIEKLNILHFLFSSICLFILKFKNKIATCEFTLVRLKLLPLYCLIVFSFFGLEFKI